MPPFHLSALKNKKCKEHITKIQSLAGLEALFQAASKGFQEGLFLFIDLSLITLHYPKKETEGRGLFFPSATIKM